MHEFVGLYSDPQCDAGTIKAVVYIRVLHIEPTSEQVSQTLLQVSQTMLEGLHVSQTVLRWSWQHEWTENCVSERIQELEPGQSNHIMKATR